MKRERMVLGNQAALPRKAWVWKAGRRRNAVGRMGSQ